MEKKPHSETESEKEEAHQVQQIGAYSLIPFIIAVSPFVGWYLGRWLDAKFSTDPYLMFLGILLGCGAAVREVYRMIKRFGDGI